ncbi:hypothetical protein [Actinacidiphila sp. ITFR-21]|uniref:hypothetical protein n=1 Tax=Actinacidiphila sp. ITFR-21 TaxID=3075199 RepID=UPI00288AF8AB|nr:hypothetical protein [Streptomyces sp. ITFR-21]WNI14111.1 hypothetical protein RLT57_00265 [Streptomyces sp. ITFR-21]
MTIAEQSPTLSDELRDRAGSFVNSHVDLWVEVAEDGVLALAANRPAAVFQAAADWLTEGADYTVADASWLFQQAEPACTLRLALRRSAPAG